jgi:glycosyltransferase involved in cell wall biosynthesis
MKACGPTGIRDVDLGSPLPGLQAADGEEAILVFFWENNVPVGRRLFLAGELPVAASAMPSVAAAACAGAILKRDAEEREHDDPGIKPEDISVVVCTRERADDLRRCLRALLACKPAPSEIIIVDNAEKAGSLVDVIGENPLVRLIHETRPGLSRARNAGLRAASGKIVAFTDDDVEVTPNWISCVARTFCDPRIGAVTGPVLPFSIRSGAEFAFEFDLGGLASSLVPKTYDKAFLRTRVLRAPKVWDIGAGANMSIRKVAFANTGPFDERLGAGASGCSEDSEFLYRLLDADWICRYEPAVVVRHRHRNNVVALRNQSRAYMRGHVVALLIQYREHGNLGNLNRALLDLPRYFLSWAAIRAAYHLGARWTEPWSPAGRATRLAHVIGWAEGLVYLLRNAAAPKFDSPKEKTQP